jgi:hypothetical protein
MLQRWKWKWVPLTGLVEAKSRAAPHPARDQLNAVDSHRAARAMGLRGKLLCIPRYQARAGAEFEDAVDGFVDDLA